MAPSLSHDWTRRALLVRGGLLAGALAVGWAPRAASAGAAAAGLDATRRRTYEALVEAVISQPSLRLESAWARTAADELAAAYEVWPVDRRERADCVLDELERSPAVAFSRLDAGERARHVRACTQVAHAQPTGAEAARLRLADEALALVALTVGPPPDDGHRLLTI